MAESRAAGTRIDGKLTGNAEGLFEKGRGPQQGGLAPGRADDLKAYR